MSCFVPTSELTVESLTNQLRNTMSYSEDNGINVNFRELNLGPPISTLLTRTGGFTATSSSSSSSGSVSGRTVADPSSNIPRKSDSNYNNHSGELSGSSVESSSKPTRNFKSAHGRSYSIATHLALIN
ncbi:Hypothetical predicted protein [Olea europaea subsp. europaea]|uniref:Uncharacterized protein n=1 Tax=Olea europaea subsp. europaea TaxID=158383 RepID=A0A8S0Q7E2_OLEEU|nr:Hypothetical predicted protein [Olea europaea subsp. europaea]